MAMGGYLYAAEFPREAFVQEALESHFKNLGFEIHTAKYIDLICSHPVTGEEGQIEAKGKTAAMGLDFRTALDQLIQRMSDPESSHAIAVPG